MMNKRLLELFQQDAVKLGTFTLASGKVSNYYIDARRVTLSSEGAFIIGANILNILKNYPIDAIGGLTLGADPIVGAVLSITNRYNLKGFTVRKATKDHGTKKLIEGPLEPNMKICVVEDVTTTGESALQAVRAVQDIGCEVKVIISVLDRLEGARELFEKHNIPFHSLLTINDLNLTS